MRRYRLTTWLIAGWTLFWGLLTVFAIIRPGYPEALAALWLFGVLPLGSIWYARRPGVTRIRATAAIVVVVAILWLASAVLRPEVPT